MLLLLELLGSVSFMCQKIKFDDLQILLHVLKVYSIISNYTRGKSFIIMDNTVPLFLYHQSLFKHLWFFAPE